MSNHNIYKLQWFPVANFQLWKWLLALLLLTPLCNCYTVTCTSINLLTERKKNCSMNLKTQYRLDIIITTVSQYDEWDARQCVAVCAGSVRGKLAAPKLPYLERCNTHAYAKKQRTALQLNPSQVCLKIPHAFGMTACRMLLGCVIGSYLRTLSVCVCVSVFP